MYHKYFSYIYMFYEFEFLSLNMLPRSSTMDSGIGLARDVMYTDAPRARDVTELAMVAAFTPMFSRASQQWLTTLLLLFIVYKKLKNLKKTLIINRPKNCSETSLSLILPPHPLFFFLFFFLDSISVDRTSDGFWLGLPFNVDVQTSDGNAGKEKSIRVLFKRQLSKIVI